jgi:hypothetical protein
VKPALLPRCPFPLLHPHRYPPCHPHPCTHRDPLFAQYPAMSNHFRHCLIRSG